MRKFYDRASVEITKAEYDLHFDDATYCSVAKDRVGEVDVLSAWIGSDQSSDSYMGGTAKIFGTILFDRGTDQWSGEVFTATELECRNEHARRIAELEAAQEQSADPELQEVLSRAGASKTVRRPRRMPKAE